MRRPSARSGACWRGRPWRERECGPSTCARRRSKPVSWVRSAMRATSAAALDGSEDLTASLSDLEAQSEYAYAHGRIREALDRAREAYRLRSDVAARSAAAEVHYHLAQYYRDLGKYGLALESLLRARMLWRGLGDLVAHAQAL